MTPLIDINNFELSLFFGRRFLKVVYFSREAGSYIKVIDLIESNKFKYDGRRIFSLSQQNELLLIKHKKNVHNMNCLCYHIIVSAYDMETGLNGRLRDIDSVFSMRSKLLNTSGLVPGVLLSPEGELRLINFDRSKLSYLLRKIRDQDVHGCFFLPNGWYDF